MNKAQRFDTSLPFSHTYPYEDLFRERVPMIITCQLALAHFRANWVTVGGAQPGARGEASVKKRMTNNMFWATECGVYAGNSLIATARLLQDFGLEYQLIGLDTFEGLPAISERDNQFAPEKAVYRTKTLFADSSISDVEEKLSSEGFRSSVWLVKGLFADTLPKLPERTYHFVNIDCDLYDPHIECLEYFYPRMEPGGVIYFDDYHSVDFPMARHAIDAFLQGKPERLIHMRYGEDGPNHTKTFIVKT